MGSVRSREDFEHALIDLIAHRLTSRRRGPGRVAVDAQTPLFDSGLVDSLAILELIAFVERATGRPIPPRQVQMKHFGTIERICTAFWVAESPGPAGASGDVYDERDSYDDTRHVVS
jgi:acyl carrier protein